MTATPTSTAQFTTTDTPTDTPGTQVLTTPIVYPNPVSTDDPKVAFTLNAQVTSVTVEVVTDSFRVVYKNVETGTFNIGPNTVGLPVRNLNLANGLYYVIIRLPDGTTESVGKMVIVR